MADSKSPHANVDTAKAPLGRGYLAGIETLLGQANSQVLANLWRNVCPLPVDEPPERHAVIEDLADFAEQLQPCLDNLRADELCGLIEKYAARRGRGGNERARADQARNVPAFHCPGCGQPVPDAKVMHEHERFLKRLFDRQEELQRSLASSIHDDLAQQLAGALLYFEGAQQLSGGSRGGWPEHFRAGLKLLQNGIHTARRIAGRLQPLICDGNDVELGIEYLIHEMQSRDGPEIVLQVQGEMDRLAPELGSALFRILRELLTNACYHSGSEKVCLKVARSTDRLQLEVEDWGTGFEPTNVQGRAFGLQEVHQRARMLGGDVVIDSTPGKGTQVIVTFPLDNQEDKR